MAGEYNDDDGNGNGHLYVMGFSIAVGLGLATLACCYIRFCARDTVVDPRGGVGHEGQPGYQPPVAVTVISRDGTRRYSFDSEAASPQQS